MMMHGQNHIKRVWL